MKGTFHKACSCRMCRLGRGTKAGQSTRKANERKLRHGSKRALKRDGVDAVVAPIGSPYTD
jgi:hypothetical protein